MAKRRNTLSAVGMDANWQAEHDMRTLIEAEAIRADKKRFQAAAMESAFNTEPGEKT